MKLQTILKKLGNFDKVSNYQDVKNQIVVKFEKGNIFSSYGQTIAVMVDGLFYLTDKWDYSQTTTKYLSRFMGGVKKKDIEKGLETGVYKLLKD